MASLSCLIKSSIDCRIAVLLPFSYGTVSRAYWGLDQFLLHRARGFLIRRHKLPGRGTQRYTAKWVFEEEGLFHLESAYRAGRSHALA